MIRKILFCAGIILCLYPFIGNVSQRRIQQKLQNPDKKEMQRFIRIPKIDVGLPIYDKATEDVLEKGVGHVRGSSFPIGGESTHCVLAGHRGLPGAALFLRLGELKEGDLFFINSEDQVLTYKVCSIQTIRPEETDVLRVVPGKDLVSLVTCTPYGINTHRLIVTGERWEEEKSR